MPRKFDLKSSLKICIQLDKTKDDKEYLFDYSSIRSVEPFALLLISSKIREFQRKHNDSRILVKGCKDMPYAFTMGYFKSIGEKFSNEPESDADDICFPMEEFNIVELKKKAKEQFDNNMDNCIKSSITEPIVDLLKMPNTKIFSGLEDLIQEAINNSIEHSNSETFWVCALYWKERECFEIAILDEGIGIEKSLNNNKKIKINNNKDSLKIALQPGGTGMVKKLFKKSTRDARGVGLYINSNVFGILGDYVICSDNMCLIRKDNFYSFEKTAFNGTITRMRIDTSKIDSLLKTKAIVEDEANVAQAKVSKLKEINIDSLSNTVTNQLVEEDIFAIMGEDTEE